MSPVYFIMTVLGSIISSGIVNYLFRLVDGRDKVIQRIEKLELKIAAMTGKVNGDSYREGD